MKFLKPTIILLALVILANWACTQSREDQPPSNRDGVSDGSADRADKPSDGQARTPSRQPSAPKGEVKRGEFTVQVGIFDRPEAADQLAYELRAQRINNFIQPVGRRWRVCVGRYYSRDRAERTLRQLTAMGFTQAVIIAPETQR
ncbi:MAG: SPOR domain-containing protein [candidate division KSB1 bacterium]|nr:SPOR domain-containing protein [candidate division KSB1 bacterium]MDZ7301608.1 SPOR domain-containing protein [candidate division KSB1 bacterium]MDZ7310976.1 SPOR domain-containing protein [candidate division KSB1 bacterium]